MTIKTILIIEDDLFQLKLLVKMLSKITKAKISVASNGQEALTSLNKLVAPDLILCDLSMPEMDGIEFLRIISTRQLDTQIVLTSSADEDVISSVKQMACLYGLSNITSLKKPIASHHLVRLLTGPVEDETIKTPYPQMRYQAKYYEIVNAFEQGTFEPFFQPHINAKTNVIVGAEALIRWHHPTKGVLTPNYFLERLVRLGLIYKLTLKTLDFSIAACARWHRMGLKYTISVNVSPSDLSDLNFTNIVQNVLSLHELPAKYLTLEITETEVIPQQAKALETLSRLRLIGVNISIDDYGIGFSSLKHLISGPFTELKVDKLFIRKMLTDKKHFAAVKSSLTIAQHLNLNSVAEGVESEAQARALTNLGCDVLQGWLYAPAMPEGTFLDWCRNHEKSRFNLWLDKPYYSIKNTYLEREESQNNSAGIIGQC